MGGHIWVDSEPGKGSTFHFTTLFRSNKEVAPKRFRASPGLAGIRVLIVDDNATNRLILEEAVSDWQMRPTCVDSGLAALDALRSAAATGVPFELLLLDAMMLDMDGFEVAQRCKDDPKLAGSDHHDALFRRCRFRRRSLPRDGDQPLSSQAGRHI